MALSLAFLFSLFWNGSMLKKGSDHKSAKIINYMKVVFPLVQMDVAEVLKYYHRRGHASATSLC